MKLFTSKGGFRSIDQTPLHGITEPDDDATDAQDLGTIVHGVVLTGEANVALIDAADWRTKVARDAREAARGDGKTPLLVHKWAEVKAMVDAIRQQLERHPGPPPFVGGYAEQSLFFELDGVTCRATPDWVSRDYTRIVDLKTTGISAHPGAWSRTVWGNGNALQNALYRRAVKAVYGVTATFEWVVVETYPPYALSMVALDPEAEAFADAQLDEALRVWKLCEATGEWPGYPTRTAYAEVPAWMQAQWQERGYYRAELSSREAF